MTTRTTTAQPATTAIRRRDFLALAAAVTCSGWQISSLRAAEDAKPRRLFFTSQGKTALINADGTGLRFFEFDIPNQATWQPTSVFPDGERVIFLSMEPRRDGPGKPFDEYYTQTPTHIWIHNLKTGALDEICTKERQAPFVTPALLVGEDRLLIQVIKNRVGNIQSVKLDGSDARDFTKPGEGLPYGFNLSPDGKRVAFHIAGPEGYQVFTSDVDGGNRVKVVGSPQHLYFAPVWSPDGQWLAYSDCLYHEEPGHDWCDVCINRPDGSEHRKLTDGKSMWFSASYGNLKQKGGGSNGQAWTKDGAILFPRRTPGAQVAWKFRVGQPDLDHFNRDFKPEEAKGGTELCRMNPQDGSQKAITHSDPAVWDFRASVSADGQQIVFCRCATGDMPAVWIMNADGSEQRNLFAKLDVQGADHPRWLQ